MSERNMYFAQSLYYCWFINFWFSFNCICVKKNKNYSSYILLSSSYFPSSINIFLWCVELIISVMEDWCCDDVHVIDVCCVTPQMVTWVWLIRHHMKNSALCQWSLPCQSWYWIWTSALNVQHITAQSVTQCGMKLDSLKLLYIIKGDNS